MLDRPFRWLSRRLGFLSALTLATSGAALLLVLLVATLIAVGALVLSLPVAPFLPPFGATVLALLVAGLLVWLHLAVLRGAGLGQPGLDLVRAHIGDRAFRAPRDPDDVLRLHEALGRLPFLATGISVVYASLVGSGLLALRHVLLSGQVSPGDSMTLPVALFSVFFTVHVFAIQILTGLFSGPARHRVKQHLFGRRIPFRETTNALVGRRFMLLVLLVCLAFVELAVLTAHGQEAGLARLPLAVGPGMLAAIAILAFLSFQSVSYSLREIEVGLTEIAYGLRRGSGEERQGPGADLIEAAYEIAGIRSNLEQKIVERTMALSETMSALRETLDDARTIQLQQDGDFFLTSLLLEPLSKNRASCVNLSVEFLVEEKKKFHFKHWEKEIGGDICIAHSIFLKNRIYTVVMNADAMGKSMQGAGGAIVIGASIKSIIDRTRFSSMEQDRHPEDWLHRAYVELQRVFESFEGSMLVSMVLGLIDDESGLMYYINVEHPWTVLYRGGRAVFIESELRLRKLGVTVPGMPFAVQLFRFRPGDVILMGSDGRDDLLVHHESGEPCMNEDEEMFLRVVEEGCGRLEGVHQALRDRGTITDDLSLIRIAFKEEQREGAEASVGGEDRSISGHGDEGRVMELLTQARHLKGESPGQAIESLRAILALQKDHRVALKGVVRLLVRQHDYAGALPYLDRYIDLRPDDTEMLYVASYCLVKTDSPARAAELCERIVLRRPDEVRYLLHLARIQAMRHDYFEADRLLDQILKIAPDNEQALSLKNSL